MLAEYVHTRWGVVALAFGVVVVGRWWFGGGDAPSTGGSGPPRPGAHGPRAATTIGAVKMDCQRAGVTISKPSEATATAPAYPGLPRVRGTVAPPPFSHYELYRWSRTVREREKDKERPLRLVHAPLLHKAARGYRQVADHYRYLSRDPRAAAAFFARRRSQKRARRASMGMARGTIKTPGGAKLGKRWLIDRWRWNLQRSLNLYYKLVHHYELRTYPSLDVALLEYASVLVDDDKPTAKRIQRAKRTLSRLARQYRSSEHAIEAVVMLSSEHFAAGRCAEVLRLLRHLPTGSAAAPASTLRRSTVRGLGQLYAGLCHLRTQASDEALPCLAQALVDARRAPKELAKLARTIRQVAREKMVEVYADSAATSSAWTYFRRFGPQTAGRLMGALVGRLVAQGKLQRAGALCRQAAEPAKRTVPAAKKATTNPRKRPKK